MLRDTFGAKSRVAWLKAVACFMRKHNYVYCQKMNEATHNPQEVYQEAREFLEFSRPLIHGPHCNRCWIFNMDQTPLYFSYHSSKTYEKYGSKTIHIHKMSNRTKRAMVVFTVTAAGNFLMPMIIFKGKPGGMIEKKELPKFDPSSIYACQDAAWMDEGCMMLWVNQILGPYLAVNPLPPGIQPVILLDAYRCHMMASVVAKISELGIKVIHFPGGCTGLCQPLDVSPLKHPLRDLWEEWMTDMLDKEGEICDATRKEVAEWTANVYWQMMGSKILKNVWQKTGYDWFEGVGNDNNNDDDGDDNNIGDVDNEFDVGNGDEDESNFNDEYNDDESNFDSNVEEAEA
jgi:hypothetical protein